MPVEARDIGIFVAFLLTFLLFYSFKFKLVMGKSSLHVLLVSFALTIPLAVDVVTSYSGLRPTTNDIRLASGILFGIGAGIIIAGWDRELERPSSKPIEPKHLAFILLSIPLHPLISYASQNTLAGFVLFSLLSVAGYLLLLFLCIRLLVLESNFRYFKDRSKTAVAIIAIGFEALLLAALGCAHYAGVLIS